LKQIDKIYVKYRQPHTYLKRRIKRYCKTMKKFQFIFALIMFVPQLIWAQAAPGYHIDEVNGQTIYTCEGNFFDSGGFIEHC